MTCPSIVQAGNEVRLRFEPTDGRFGNHADIVRDVKDAPLRFLTDFERSSTTETVETKTN